MSFFVKNLSAQRCMLLYWQCQGEPIFVSSDGKAARAAGLFPVVNGSGSMPVMRRQTGASERRQYSDRQEQIRASNTTTTRNRSAAQTAFRPAEQKNRLNLTPPIQQHTGIYQYTTLYHSAEQRRAWKGGARGGKAGFVTLSAFPPRKLAHAKVSPRKGKSSTAKESPWKGNALHPGAYVRRPTLYNIWYNFLINFINSTFPCIL